MSTVDFTMTNSIHEKAKEAIDEDVLAEVLEQTVGAECEQDVVEALREVTADEIVADARAAARYARHRGRGDSLTADDVGNAAIERRGGLPPIGHADFESP